MITRPNLNGRPAGVPARTDSPDLTSTLISSTQRQQAQGARQQQIEADRTAREQDKAQRDADKEAQRQANDAKEAQFRREGRPQYVDAHGDIQPVQTDEEWQAKQARERANADRYAQFKREGRPFFEDKVTREVVPTHTDEQWTKIKADRDAKAAEKLRKDQINAELHAHDADATYAATQPGGAPLDKPSRAKAQKTLADTTRAAVTTLLPHLDQQAQATTGSIPFLKSPTPEADAASKRSKALREKLFATTDPHSPVPLDEEDLATLAKVKPELHQQLISARSALEQDDAAQKAHQQRQQARAELLLKRDDPAKWEALQRQKIATDPTTAAGDLTTQHARQLTDLTAQLDAFESQARKLDSQRADIEAQNQALAQQGIAADDAITVTGPDGQPRPWSRKLYTQLQQIQEQAHDLTREDNPERQRLQLAHSELQRTQQLAQEAHDQASKAADAKRQGELAKIATTAPKLAADLHAIDQDSAARLADLQEMHPEGIPDDVRNALAQDIQQKQQAAIAAQTQRQQAGSDLYRQLRDFNPTIDWTNPPDDIAKKFAASKAKELGLDEHDAQAAIATARASDWSTPLPGEEHTADLRSVPILDQMRTALTDTRSNVATAPYRLLPDGSATINPALALDKKQWDAAIAAAGKVKPQSPEHLAALEQQRQNMVNDAGARAWPMLATTSDYQNFVADHDKNDPGFKALSVDQKAAKFLTEGKGQQWFLDKLASTTGQALLNGLVGLGNTAIGLAHMATGSQWLADRMQAADTYRSFTSQQQAATGIQDSTLLRSVAAITDTTVQLAPSLMGGAVGQIAGRVVGALATAEKAAGYLQTLQKASSIGALVGGSLAGGAQTTQQVYTEAYQHGLDAGMTADQARSAATMPALAAGLGTTILAGLQGLNGVASVFRGEVGESITSALGKDTLRNLAKLKTGGISALSDKAVRTAVADATKALGGHMLQESFGLKGEALNEFLDQLQQGIVAKATYEPDKKPGEILAESLQAGLLGGVTGGLVGGIHGGVEIAGAADPVKTTPLHQRPEVVRMAESQLETLTDPVMQQRGGSLLAIAQGQIDQLTPEELAPLGLSIDDKGKLSATETPDGTPAAVKLVKGQPVITQAALDELETTLPAVRRAIGMDEAEATQYFTQRKDQATKAPSTDSPTALPGSESAQAGANQPTDVGAGHETGASGPASATATAAGGPPTPAASDFSAIVQQVRAKKLSQVDAARQILAAAQPQTLESAAAILQQHLKTSNNSDANARNANARNAKALLDTIDWQPSQPTASQNQASQPKAKTASSIENPASSTQTGAPVASLLDDPAYTNGQRTALSKVPPTKRTRLKQLFTGLDQHLVRYGHFFPGGIKVTETTTGDQKLQTGAGIAVDVADRALHIDFQRLAESFDSTDPKRAARDLKTAFQEEMIHSAQIELRHTKPERHSEKALADLFRKLPEKLQQRIYGSYHVGDIERKVLADTLDTANASESKLADLMDEYGRMLIQDEEFQSVTEVTIADNPALKPALVQWLRDLIASLSRLLKGAPRDVQHEVQEYKTRAVAVLHRLLKQSPSATATGSTLAKQAQQTANLANTPSTRSVVQSSSIQNPASSIQNAKPKPLTGTAGSETTAYTDNNDAITTRWHVAEVDDLVISNDDSGRINPDYPQILQPRDRTSAGSEAQVNDIAGNTNLDRLSHSPSVGDGAPIVSPDDSVVESGNGRLMGLRRAYAQSKPNASTYRDALIARAAEFGIDPEKVKSMKHPVLVRARMTPVDRSTFVLAANVSNIAPKREVEIAKTDARQITPDLFATFTPDPETGDFLTPDNHDFIRAFVRDIVPQAERPGIIDSRGQLSQTGQRRLRNALFAYAYGDSPEALNALANLTESTDPKARNISTAIVGAAPVFAEQNAREQAGALYPLSITSDIVVALQGYLDAKAAGQTVDDWLAQDRIPGIDNAPTELQASIQRTLDANANAPRKLLDILSRYARIVDNAGDPRQASLFGDKKPTKADLWKLASKPQVLASATRPSDIPEPLPGEHETETTALNQQYYLARDAKPQLDAFAERIAQRFGSTAITPPLKGRKRALQKARIDYGGDFGKLKDLARATIECRDLATAKAIVAEIERTTGQTAKRNLFDANPVDGYRDALMNLRFGDATVELQVHVPEVLKVKHQLHVAYVGREEILRKAAEEKRPLTEREQFRVDRMNRIMRKFYNEALGLPADLGMTEAEKQRAAAQSRSINSSASSGEQANPPALLTSSSEMGRGGSVSNAQPAPDASRTTANPPMGDLSGTSKNPVARGNVEGIITPNTTTEQPLAQGQTIGLDNIQDYAGNVDTRTLATYRDAITSAFATTPGSQTVPLSALRSTKNELAAPKFRAGIKGDPRQTAADWIVKAIRREPGAKPRAPLDVIDNGNGTYTIQDGNATAQALMLAGWTKVPVIVQRNNTLKTATRLPADNQLDLFDLLTPAQQSIKLNQPDLFAGTSNETPRTPVRPRQPRAPAPARPASQQPDSLGELFAQPSRPGAVNRPGQPGKPGRSGSGQPGRTGDLFDALGNDAGTGGNTGSRSDGAAPTGGGTPDSSGTDRTDATASDRLDGQRTGPQRVERPAPDSPDRNYSGYPGIPQGNKAKIRANLEAITLLKQLEAEGRNATPEEKETLARYTGWGAFKEAFNEPMAKRLRTDKEQRERYSYMRNYPMADDLASWEKNHFQTYTALREAMSEEEFSAAARSTLNAHYTDPKIIRSIWDTMRALGFRGGNVLEPSVGTGFFLSQQPADMADNSRWSAVELDDLTARLFSKLYPEATINEHQPDATRDVPGLGFERARIPDNSQDLIISNVPFFESGPPDARYPLALNLHNYFFARALDKVKPGGLVAFITSSSTMQNNIAQRKFLASKGDLVAAFRLPNDAFKANAGTEVTTDFIIMRKPDGSPFQSQPWTNLVEHGRQEITVTQNRDEKADDFRRRAKTMGDVIADSETMKGDRRSVRVSAPIMINEYFAAHPEHALGQHSLEGSMWRGNEYALVSMGGDVAEQLSDLGKALPRVMGEGTTPTLDNRGQSLANATEKPFAYVERDGKPHRVKDDRTLEALDWSPKTIATWKSWRKVRDALRALVAAENNAKSTDETLAPLRATLNRLYDDHIAKFKALRARHPNPHADFRDDPDFPFTAALENEKKRTDPTNSKKVIYRYEKAPIFTQRIIQPTVPPTSATDAPEALTHSLGWRNRIDIPWIAELLRTDEATARQQLLAMPTVFEDPASGQLETSDKYLSGNVRQKLAIAESAAIDNPALRRNVEALRAAQPAHVSIGGLPLNLGERWLPSELYNAFAREVIKANATFRYVAAANEWKVNGFARNSEFSTHGMNAVEIMESLMNSREPAVHTGTGKDRKFDPDATALAKSMAGKIQRAFEEWILSSDTPVTVGDQEKPAWQHAEDIFNTTQNNYVVPKHSGEHLTFPGLSTDVWRKPHRRAVIARFLTERHGMMAHGVGSGKTFNQIILAMELRRLGFAKRPMIVVQNSTLGDFAADFLKAYPNANILVGDDTVFEKSRRREFVSRVVTGDYDAIILPHSQFSMIPHKPEVLDAYLSEQIRELEDLIAMESNGNAVRDLEGMKLRLEQRRQQLLDKLEKRQDNTLFWEDLGIDALIVDEAHKFKSVPIITRKTRIKGIPAGVDSQSGIGMLLKARSVQARNNGRNVFLATGTPIKNTMAEAYIMMMIASPHILADYGIYNFDDFASKFGREVSSTEISWGTTPKVESRFAKFIKGQQLITMIRSSFDVAMGNDKMGIDVPAIKGGAPEMRILPASPAMKRFNVSVRAVAEAFARTSSKTREENNFKAVPAVTLQVGLAAALDPRLVSSSAYDDPQSKVNQCVRDVLDKYKAGKDRSTTQAIFSDLNKPFNTSYLDHFASWAAAAYPDLAPALTLDMGTGSERADDFNLFSDIKKKLVAGGIPADQIAIVDASMSKAQRTAVFAKVNEGEVRVVLGSTETIGVGANFQRRLAAVHHLMPPKDFTPAMMEQRNGRIIRQGNLHAATVDGEPAWNTPVSITNYGVEGSMDSAIYGTLARKQRFITQLLMGENIATEFDDPADPIAVNMAEMAARTMGDPDFLRRVELEKILSEMRAERQGHLNELAARKRKLSTQRQSADKYLPDHIARLASQQAAIGDLMKRSAPVPDGVKPEAAEGKSVYAFGDQVIDTAAKENNKIIEPLDIWLATESKALDRKGKTAANLTLTVNGIPVPIEIHQAIPGVLPGGMIQLGDKSIGFSGARSLLDKLRSIPEDIARNIKHATAELESVKASIAALESQLAKATAYEREDEYQAAEQEMQQVDARIAAKAKPPTAPTAAATEDSSAVPTSTLATPTRLGYSTTDELTGHTSYITGSQVTREQGQAHSAVHAARLSRLLAAGQGDRSQRQDRGTDRPGTVPRLSREQFQRILDLPVLGRGLEAEVYGDRANGVVYKVLWDGQDNPSHGIFPELQHTSAGRLDWHLMPAEMVDSGSTSVNPRLGARRLAERLAVQSLIGGTPTEIAAVGPEGHIVLKQPWSPDPDMTSPQTGSVATANERAGLARIPANLISDPEAPPAYVAVITLDGQPRPYFVTDLAPRNYVGDSQGDARINDAAIAPIPATLLNQVPALRPVVEAARQNAQAQGERSNRLFSATRPGSMSPMADEDQAAQTHSSTPGGLTEAEVQALKKPGETIVYSSGGSQFASKDRSVAMAYASNPGFGGDGTIYASSVKLEKVLRNPDWRELVEDAGLDFDSVSSSWDRGSYMALEEPEVQEWLKENGYDAVEYQDDFPDGADVVFLVEEPDWEPTDLDPFAGRREVFDSWGHGVSGTSIYLSALDDILGRENVPSKTFFKAREVLKKLDTEQLLSIFESENPGVESKLARLAIEGSQNWQGFPDDYNSAREALGASVEEAVGRIDSLWKADGYTDQERIDSLPQLFADAAVEMPQKNPDAETSSSFESEGDGVNSNGAATGTPKSATDQSGVNSFDSPTPTTGVDTAAHEAATSPRNDLPEPTEAQKKAGNYTKGHIRISGLPMSIENPADSVRSGTDASGKPWSTTMHAHYGYVLDSEGKDGDHVDVFVKPGTPEDYTGPVFVVDQIDPATGKFDEHKSVIGVNDAEAAAQLYQSNYEPGWRGLGPITQMPWEAFKSWSRSAAAKKPAARTPHPTVNPIPGASLTNQSPQGTPPPTPAATLQTPTRMTTEPGRGAIVGNIAGVSSSAKNAPGAWAFNHIDKAFTDHIAKLGKMVMSTKPVQALADYVGNTKTGQFFENAIKSAKKHLAPMQALAPEALAMYREMNIKSAFGKELAMDVFRSLDGKGKFTDLAYPPGFAENKDAKRDLYLAMTGGKPMEELAPELQQLAKQLRTLLVRAGEEAVTSGRMSRETFDNLKGNYLPHYYAQDARPEPIWTKAARVLGIRDVLAQRTTAWHLVDTETTDPRTGKAGDEGALVTWDGQGKQWRFRSSEHLNAFYHDFIADQVFAKLKGRRDPQLQGITREALNDPKHQLTDYQQGIVREMKLAFQQRYKRKAPLTVEEQEKAGLLMDPVYSVVRYLAQMHHDNAVADFFNEIAARAEWTSDTPVQGYTPIPDSRKYGRLAGKYVQDTLARQILDVVGDDGALMDLYDDLVRRWSSGKTVWNPGTHVRNFLGNIVFTQLAGVNLLNPVANWSYYRDAVKLMRGDQRDLLRAAYEHGVIGADYSSAELRGALRGLLPDPDMMGDKAPSVSAISAWAHALTPEKLRRAFEHVGAKAHTVYAGTDDFFKLAAWMKHRAMGATDAAAAAEVRKWFPYYDGIGSSGALKFIRRVHPFFSFFREAVRILGNAVKERPLSLTGSMIMPLILTRIAAALTGLRDDRDREQVERDMKGHLKVFSSLPVFSILLPWRMEGKLAQFDLTNIHPFANLLSTNLDTKQEDLITTTAKQVMAGSPITGLLYSMATNQDPFNNRAITQEDMGVVEKNWSRFKHTWTQLAPAILGSVPNQLTSSFSRSTNKTLEKRNVTQSFLRGILGIDIRNASPDLYRLAEDFRKANHLSENVWSGGTTAQQRLRQALFSELVQDDPNLSRIKNIVLKLRESGKPVESQQDINRLLFYRNPTMIVDGKLNQMMFQAGLPPEASRLLQDAQTEFRRVQQVAPATIALALSQP